MTEASQAEIGTLAVTNLMSKPVLFVSGEIVFGGFQDRMVTDSVLAPPGQSLLAVACVESGRWAGAVDFDRHTGLGPRQLRSNGSTSASAATVSQAVVWHAVEKILAETNTPHPTGSIRAVVDHADGGCVPMLSIRPLPGQCGVAVGRGAAVLGVEVFHVA